MTVFRWLCVVVILAAGHAPLGWTQPPVEDPQVEAVRQAATAYLKALAEGNRNALLAAWSPDGCYVDAAGRSFQARPMIESEFSAGTKAGHSIGSIADQTIRLVTPDVAIQDGTTLHTATPGEPVPKSRFTAIWVKRDGKWLLDGIRESVVPLPPTNSRLAELDWLKGTFAGMADDGSQVVVSSELSSDGNFLLREFAIKAPDESEHTVSQRIGWDPLTNGFRSWTFDSLGGYSDGVWKRQADNWIVQNTGVTSKGQHSAATALYTDINAQGFTLEIEAAMLDSDPEPDVKVRMERQDG